jgi:hypothetical protein
MPDLEKHLTGPAACVFQHFMCGRCGVDLNEEGIGYQERHHGIDPETGYQDVELVCSDCVAEEERIADEEADERRESMYAHADMVYRMGIEDYSW